MLQMQKLIEGARLLGLSLTPAQIKCFQTYYDELADWNHRMNLTAIVDYEEVQVKHFLDSLTVATALSKAPATVMDVGAGAGLPGVALKILYPDIALTLVDSVRKKAVFLNHLVDVLKLDGVQVVAGRAEELAHDAHYRKRFDAVVSRGVARLAVLAELALPFCKVGGVFIAMKKLDAGDEIDEAGEAIDIMGGRIKQMLRVEIDDLSDRALIVIDKIKPTPDKYPRRSGMPQKRPLLQSTRGAA